MQQQQMPAFGEIARTLSSKIEDARNAAGKTDLVDSTNNIPRQVLQRNEDDVEALFDAACSLGKDQSRRFRAVVIGDGIGKSRAKILATILYAGVRPNSDLWRQFLKRLAHGEEARVDPGFADTHLPFSDDALNDFFGTEYKQLQDHQHLYCPVNVCSQFNDIREKLKTIIERQSDPSNLRICEIIDKNGERMNDSRDDHFCPEGAAAEILAEHGDLVRGLYLEASKANSLEPGLSSRQQRQCIAAFEDEAHKFYDGVKPRAKILATIILNDVQAKSETWRRFGDLCLQQNHENRAVLCDKRLPLTYTDWWKCLGREHAEGLDAQQDRFCAVILNPNQQVRLARELRLPLLQKRLIGEGAFGRVYAVKVAAGHFKQNERVLAMKEMTMTGANTSEWGDAQWLFKHQPMEHESIMRAEASVRTPQHIYIFFPRALCNLQQYMTGKSSINFAAGPADFKERMKFLGYITDIAHALNYLHKQLLDTDEHSRALLIHEDLKAENILVTLTKDHKMVYQITDFGISSIKHTPRGGSESTVVNRNQMFSTAGRSLRGLKTETVLGDACPNYAPESCSQRLVDSSVDIWAFGTVFAEYVAWESGGSRALESYNHARGGCTTADERPLDYYRSFELDEATGEPVVKKSIWKWFDKLVEGANNPQDKCFYEKSYELLKHHLLICNPEVRARSKEVYKILCAILRSEDLDVPGLAMQRLERRPTREGSQSPLGSGLTSPRPQPLQNSQNGYKSTPETPVTQPDDERNSHVQALQNVERERRLESRTCIGSVSSSPGTPSHAQPPSSEVSTPAASSTDVKTAPDDSLDGAGRTPLLRAMVDNDLPEVWRLLDSARLDVADNCGMTALHHAVRLSDPNLVERLLSLRPALVDALDHRRQTALHLCARFCYTVTVVQHARILLRTGSANPSLRDALGRSALFFATNVAPSAPGEELVTLLLEYGAELQDQTVGNRAQRFEAVREAQRGRSSR